MLDTFRKASKTWIVKLLFALLVLSFMAWGVEGVRHAAVGTSPAIEVGNVTLSAAEVNTEFKREVERMQPMFGGKLTTEEARKLGLLDRTVDSIVTRTLVDQAGKQLGLAASDDAILRAVAASPDLRDEKGQFDRRRLQAALARMGLTEDGFFRQERTNQIRNQIADVLSGGVSAPAVMVDPLLRRREEQRVADTVTIRDSAMPQPAAPDAATVDAYYKANAARFMAPEYRAVTALLLRPADVSAQIEVSDSALEEAYQQRQAEFNTPERRQVSQIIIADDAEAAKARDLVSHGKDLATIAKALGREILDLGSLERTELPDDLAAAVFAQAPGTTAPPLKTALGWHVVKITGVTPAHSRSLAEVRGQLEQDIRREKAGDLLSDLSNKVEDALGGGASLEEAAQRFNLKAVKAAALDSQGRGTDGKPVAGLPKAPAFLDVAFHADVNSESQLTENPGDGFFMLRVDSITPPAPRPLTAVTAEVSAAWAAEQRHAMARTRADRAAEALKAGEALDSVARQVAGEAKTTQPFTREGGAGAGLPPSLATEMFAKVAGDVAVAASQGGWTAARLDRIIPFDPAARPGLRQTTQRTLSQAVAGDLVDQYLAALNAKVGVKIDRSQLSREE
jgi:peptidyl-prolyl cis-trans isomerase D